MISSWSKEVINALFAFIQEGALQGSHFSFLMLMSHDSHHVHRDVPTILPASAAALGLTVCLVSLLWAEQRAQTCSVMHAPQTGYLWGLAGTLTPPSPHARRDEQVSCSCEQRLPPDHQCMDAASERTSSFCQAPAVKRLSRS